MLVVSIRFALITLPGLVTMGKRVVRAKREQNARRAKGGFQLQLGSVCALEAFCKMNYAIFHGQFCLCDVDVLSRNVLATMLSVLCLLFIEFHIHV